MARKVFNAGKARGKTMAARPTTSPLPAQTAQQITAEVKAAGIDTALYPVRQNNFSRRSQTWIWDVAGNV